MSVLIEIFWKAMPIYEYHCNGCGHEFEILQGIKESPLTDCPACTDSGLRKKISAAAFHLKGTGWYETDFKNSEKPADLKSKEPDSESSSSAEKSESDTGKTDSEKKKPAVEKKETRSTASAAS